MGVETRGVAAPWYALFGSIGGAATGFVSVTLGYVLSHRGFSVAAIAGLVGLVLTPSTWRVVFGPLVDGWLDARRWILLGAGLCALTVGLFAVIPLRPDNLPWFQALALGLGLANNLAGCGHTAAVAITTPFDRRGAIAGWLQAGNLGGAGLGGGAALWAANHLGAKAAAGGIAVYFLLAGSPALWLRTPRSAAGGALAGLGRDLRRALIELISNRLGRMAILAVVLPMGLGAFGGLIASQAGAWRATPDQVALTTGALSGLVSIPGSLAGGWLCGRMSSRTALALSAVACALGELAMAFGPRTPEAFVALSLINSILLGVAYAAVAAVTLDALNAVGGATVGGLLSGLSNVPVLVMTLVLGATAKSGGVIGMMSLEAACGLVSAGLYLLIASRGASPRAGLLTPLDRPA